MSSLLIVPKVLADCTPLYGGGVTCPRRGEILIDKTVQNPSDGIMVDNLTQFDSKYAPDQNVSFRIRIKNTGDQTLDEVQIKDLMPDFVSFTSGPGTFNQSEGHNGTLTFTINNLAPSETRDYWVYGKTFSAGNLPNNLICKLQNRAQARASSDRFAEDIAEFCVEKNALGVTKGGLQIKEVPKTGPEAFALAGLSSIFGIGIYLRKKANSILN